MALINNLEAPKFRKGQASSVKSNDEVSPFKSRTSQKQLTEILEYKKESQNIVNENCALVNQMCDDRKKLMEKDKRSMDKELELLEDKNEEFDILDILIALTGIGLIFEVYKIGCAISNEADKLALKGERQALSQDQINLERYSRHAIEQVGGNHLPLEDLFCKKLTAEGIEEYATKHNNDIKQYLRETDLSIDSPKKIEDMAKEFIPINSPKTTEDMAKEFIHDVQKNNNIEAKKTSSPKISFSVAGTCKPPATTGVAPSTGVGVTA